MRQKNIWISCFLLMFIMGEHAYSQHIIRIEGYVKDAQTGEGLVDVAVSVRGTTHGTATDDNGYFSFNATLKRASDADSLTLAATYIGYEPFYTPLKRENHTYNIVLKPAAYELNEVLIRPKKERYSKKDNPALIFARKVIERRKLNDPHEHDFFSYNVYEQKSFAFDNVDVDKERKKGIYKKIDFVFNYVDTTSIQGRTLLPLYNEETVENYFYRRAPRSEKKIVTGYKRAGLIEILSEDGMKEFTDEVFQDVNIFQDNIPLFLHRFVSPLSSIGPDYYKYYLLDTLLIDGAPHLDLGFAPFNSESFGFVGHLFVALDSSYFVKKVVLNVPRDINLNFISDMTITQEYTRTNDSTRLLVKNDISLIFKPAKKARGSFVRRLALYRDHSFDKPSDMAVFDEKIPALETEGARKQTDAFWNKAREGSDGLQKTSVERMMAQLREVPVIYWGEKVLDVLVNGYVQTADSNSLFEIGPANTFFSFNDAEGARVRLGGGTTVNFSNRFFVDGYLAYGNRDEQFKGNAIVEYSFNKKKYFRQEYPFHYLRAEYKYDVNRIGQQYKYTNVDNIFTTIKRDGYNPLTYMEQAELSYYQENYGGFGYGVMLRRQTEWDTPGVPFDMIMPDGLSRNIGHYTSSQLRFDIRWAPKEKFFQTRNHRFHITMDAPIMTLSHTVARKGFGSDYNYHRTEFGIRKRFWLSPLGYVDLYGQFGKIWNRVPFPLLFIPNANMSYVIQPETFPLMNPMEFIHDSFVSWDMAYYMNGWLFNRLPLIKKLQLREVIAFRGWYGDLSAKNNPKVNGEGLFHLPKYTHTMGRIPYMEFGVGVENIFKLLCLEYVWRLSYRDHKEAPDNGIRMQLKFTF